MRGLCHKCFKSNVELKPTRGKIYCVDCLVYQQ